MSLLGFFKRQAENLPPSVGGLLSYVPFVLRLGPAYLRHSRQISAFETLSPADAEAWIMRRLRRVVSEAGRQVPFYRNLYDLHAIASEEIASLEDFRRLPIISKDDFRGSALSDRLHKVGMPINTGGTSGQPLDFQVERNAFAREWAHMHHLWYARGYQKEHLKLTFRGKHSASAVPLKYNAVHNELVVNANVPMDHIVDAAIRWNGAPIRWLHGYPSLVSEFAKALSSANAPDRDRLRSRLNGVLLGSEFPAPHYRAAIEAELSVNILSWYGHSEMSILAGEFARGLYRALPTYGYAEAVEIGSSGRYRLVATSFDNFSHPFIRYDTGDIVEPISEGPQGLIFQIVEGRVGDFINDRHGRRHSLTAVIFGRHHRAFSQIRHIQVQQPIPGKATLLITASDPSASPEIIRAGFDLSGLDIEWDIQLVTEPVRSAAGKIKLKVDTRP